MRVFCEMKLGSFPPGNSCYVEKINKPVGYVRKKETTNNFVINNYSFKKCCIILVHGIF